MSGRVLLALMDGFGCVHWSERGGTRLSHVICIQHQQQVHRSRYPMLARDIRLSSTHDRPGARSSRHTGIFSPQGGLTMTAEDKQSAGQQQQQQQWMNEPGR